MSGTNYIKSKFQFLNQNAEIYHFSIIALLVSAFSQASHFCLSYFCHSYSPFVSFISLFSDTELTINQPTSVKA